MPNTLIKTADTTAVVPATSSDGCKAALFVAIPLLFPGYEISHSDGVTTVTGHGGDVYRIKAPNATTCAGGFVKVEYEAVE